MKMDFFVRLSFGSGFTAGGAISYIPYSLAQSYTMEALFHPGFPSIHHSYDNKLLLKYRKPRMSNSNDPSFSLFLEGRPNVYLDRAASSDK